MNPDQFDAQLKDSHFFRQIIGELSVTQSEGLAIVVTALMDQLDSTKLAESLRQLIAANRRMNANPAAIQIATEVMAAADAHSALQRADRH